MHDSKVKDRNKAAKAIKSKMGPETTEQDWREYDPFLDAVQSAGSSSLRGRLRSRMETAWSGGGGGIQIKLSFIDHMIPPGNMETSDLSGSLALPPYASSTESIACVPRRWWNP